MKSSLTQSLVRIAQQLLLGKPMTAFLKALGCKPLVDYNPNPNFGVLNVPFCGYFLKIETIPGILSSELNRRKLIPTQILNLFCPMKVTSFLGTTIAYLPRRKEFSDVTSSVPYAKDIHSEFLRCGELTLLSLEANSELLSGLQVLKRYLGENAGNTIRDGIIAILQKPLQIGPVHGDFHFKNIVKIGAEKGELIDVDCFRPQGIQAFDAVYFSLEAALVEHSNTRGWLDELLAATKGQSRYQEYLFNIEPLDYHEALLLYFVDRCGQEDRFIPQLSAKSIRSLQSVTVELARLNSLDEIAF